MFVLHLINFFPVLNYPNTNLIMTMRNDSHIYNLLNEKENKYFNQTFYYPVFETNLIIRKTKHKS